MTLEMIMGYLGFVLTAIGVLLAFRSIRENIIYYEIETIGDNSGVGISHPVEIYIPPAIHSLAKIYFWNSGPKAIRKQDVVEKITIKTKTPIKSGLKIVKTNDLNNIEVQRFNNSDLSIDFLVPIEDDGNAYKNYNPKYKVG